MEKLKSDLYRIINCAIDAVKPSHLIPNKVILNDNRLIISEHQYDLTQYNNIFVLGAGKASAAMAFEIEKILGNKITSGIVATKYGHGASCKLISVIESGHPLMDANSLLAGEKIFTLANKACSNDLVICLFSGGASALFEKLPEKISLKDIRALNNELLTCGATIQEMNTIRKHLSLIKGGKLAKAIYPAETVSLILSDVIGDPLDVISSGPTVPDPTSFNDALSVLKKYNIDDKVPANIIQYLRHGEETKENETLKHNDHCFSRVTNIIIGNNKDALTTAKKTAENLGYNSVVYSHEIEGEAREVGEQIAEFTKKIISGNLPIKKPACLIWGGETTVKIHGNGKGGRNQELALSALIEMDREFENKYIIASCGTDGTDGPTKAAGAFASNDIWQKAKELKISPQDFLNNNDSFHFFQQTGGLIITGPTGTNVMDIIITLVNN